MLNQEGICTNVNEINPGDTLLIWAVSDFKEDNVSKVISLVVVDRITDSEDDVLLHFDFRNDKNRCMAWYKYMNGLSWVHRVWHLGKVNFPREGES